MVKGFAALLFSFLLGLAAAFIPQKPAMADEGWSSLPGSTLAASPQEVCDAWGQFYGGGCLGFEGPIYGGPPVYGDFVGYKYMVGYVNGQGGAHRGSP